jgi:hypothetical protein
MAQKRHVRFFVLRYALFGDEFVNIGVLLHEMNSPSGFCGVRFVSDWKRLRCLHPDADVELLDAFVSDIQSQLQGPDREEIIQTMLDSFSNAIQLSQCNELVTEDPESELTTLASIYLTQTVTADNMPTIPV